MVASGVVLMRHVHQVFYLFFLRCKFTYAIHTNISFYKLTKSAMYISEKNVVVLGWLAFFINC